MIWFKRNLRRPDTLLEDIEHAIEQSGVLPARGFVAYRAGVDELDSDVVWLRIVHAFGRFNADHLRALQYHASIDMLKIERIVQMTEQVVYAWVRECPDVPQYMTASHKIRYESKLTRRRSIPHSEILIAGDVQQIG